MKKGLLLIGITAVIVAGYFIFFAGGDDAKSDVPKQQPLAQSKNNDAFNKPFNDMLNSYFELKDALVDWDTVKATAAATKLIDMADKIPMNELKADSTIVQTAKSFVGSVVAEAKGLVGETSIEEKRHAFYTLSDNLFNLLRTVKYDQQVLYYDKCPMAFNETEEGYWLSNTTEIINPYFGNKHPKYKTGMLHCGSIEDSVNYVSK
ncbi:DUF3347 domain-containing protein [Panacibacter ginsenosidivorans]|uniref:DUF3347 domain-containing protein n=1 Tax=Panacibacter ginsenosidivorans TaxID=1813871 RepID=A0A5B8V5Q8_9BACT|nr:DUF3347 domain-containing protein [Panacibacter ginsenosidivorans]QEC66071.1 DUF3347 domain-containing protein [Panacibacter ginsenosidivorans]